MSQLRLPGQISFVMALTLAIGATAQAHTGPKLLGLYAREPRTPRDRLKAWA
jgi:hypothetical protein